MARFVISDERVVNCYGIRVMTDGIDISQYERNPVLLYMHERGRLVIGKVINLRKEGPVLTGEVVFDEGDEFAAEIKRKVDADFLRACSPALSPVAWSDAPELILVGQTYHTLTKSKLDEISIVDIPGNDNALRLSMGSGLRLSNDAAANAEIFKNLNLQLQQPPKMQLILSKLGLAANSSETAVVDAIQKVKDDADTDKANFIISLAQKAGLVSDANKDRFLKLAKMDSTLALEFLDLDKLKTAASGGAASTDKDLRLAAVVEGVTQANAAAAAGKDAPAAGAEPKDALDKLLLARPDWSARDWEKKDPANWLQLKRSKPEIHTELTRAYYGIKA